MKIKIAICIGSRPNYIKAAPVIRALRNDFDLTVIDSGQHCHNVLLSSVIKDYLKIRVDVDFEVGKIISKCKHPIDYHKLHVRVFDEMVSRFSNYFYANKPLCAMVFGDVDTALAASIAAHKNGVWIIHEEAGLRSKQFELREEHNRIIIDRLARIHLCTEQSGVENLNKELIYDHVYLVGNTMVDSLSRVVDQDSYINEPKYVVMTLHRAENVDNCDQLDFVLGEISELFSGVQIRFYAHPRTINNWNRDNINSIEQTYTNMVVFNPAPYQELVEEMQGAYIIVTDSGGIQEECAWMKKKCLTIRNATERPSTIECGSNSLITNNVLVGLEYDDDLDDWIENQHVKDIPLWDGKASLRIRDILKELVGINE